MSTLCGLTLESYVMYWYDLIVDDDRSANLSLSMAEAIGTSTKRPHWTSEEFAPFLKLFEPYRNEVEYKLLDYNEEDHGSWRSYAGYAFDFIPEEIHAQAEALRWPK